MRHRGFSLRLVAVVALLVGCSERQMTAPSHVPASAASAELLAGKSDCRHVSGSFVFTSFQFTSATTAVGAGTVQGDLAGQFGAQYFNLQQRGQGVSYMEAHHTITTSTGTITTSDEILLLPDRNPLAVRPNSRLNVVGGTGAYAGATGLLHTHGEVNLATLDGSIEYKGQVCVP